MENETPNSEQAITLESVIGNLNYLSEADITAQSYQRFIEESSKDDFEVLETLENQAIELVSTYIGSKYDVAKIFNRSNSIKNPVLTKIIARITLTELFKRNAARKVNSQMQADYDQAMNDLEKIATGRLQLYGLPTPSDESGNPIKSNTLYGNNSNKNFYI